LHLETKHSADAMCDVLGYILAFIGSYSICPHRDSQAEFTCLPDCILEIFVVSRNWNGTEIKIILSGL